LLRSRADAWAHRQTARRLDGLRRAMLPLGWGAEIRIDGFRLRVTDGPNAWTMYKDIFLQRIYHFEATRPDPLIIDGGSNIGMSVLYFKKCNPAARVIGFEPDAAIFRLLDENVRLNGLQGVSLVEAAMGDHDGAATFVADESAGGALGEGTGSVTVRLERLRRYLAEPVDFLKLNIEGAEWDVLSDCEAQLRQVREMVIEYHHLPGLPRTLHDILGLLHRQGFEYLINDFDSGTNYSVIDFRSNTNGGAVDPHFRLTPDSRYFLLIYAKRLD
jgi:FkbM family methyltransferase